jgi:alpha-beta hydrolase superfamily lysophospholipase
MVLGVSGEGMNAHVWRPDVAACGTVYIVHGLGEHGFRYDGFASYLCEYGLAVYAVDLPGHGKSPGKRGHITSLLDVVGSIAHLAEENTSSGSPNFLFGHSMGATAVLAYLANAPSSTFAGFVASSPFFRTTSLSTRTKAAMSALVHRITPSLSVHSGIDPGDLSQQPHVVTEYLEDPYVHGRVSMRLAFTLCEMGRSLLRQGLQTDRSVLLLQGSSDRISRARFARTFVERSSDSIQYCEFPGGSHELHNDVDRERYYLTVKEWMVGRIRRGV